MKKEIDKLKYYLLRAQYEEIIHWVSDSLNILKYYEISLRYNFCALGLREALRIYLARLSPDTEIESCYWYFKSADSGKITRRDRIKYLAYKNINTNIIMEGLQGASTSLRLNIEDSIKNVDGLCEEYLNLIDVLSKYTHVLGCDDKENFSKSINDIILCFNRINSNIDIINQNLAYIIQLHILDCLEIETKYFCGSSSTNNFYITKHDHKNIEFELDYILLLYSPYVSGLCAPQQNRYKIFGKADGNSLKVIEPISCVLIEGEVEDISIDVHFKSKK